MPNNDAINAALAYAQQEPDTHLQEEANRLVEDAKNGNEEANEELRKRFLGTLAFGTAGIRAKMEAGFCRLNSVTVAKSAHAIGHYLLGRGRCIVVAHDARLKSDIFAHEVSSVLRGLGFFVYEFDAPLATPLCSFAVRHLAANAGIMVTASHNPPMDNGLKVYSSRGAQIVSPADHEIEELLRNAPSYQDIVRAPREKSLGRVLKVDEVLTPYLDLVKNGRLSPSANRSPLRVIYTPLHGVGYRFLEAAFAKDSSVDLRVVESQRDPDGNFPTLAFPNPEEEGALDRAIVDARLHSADAILANDPDVDRLAFAVPKYALDDFTMLTGNELGAILGCDAIENSQTQKKKLVVSTLVSSRQLKSIAEACGATYAESLTGFSRIAQIAHSRETKHAEQFIFGFEEALGYCVGDFVRDKDGICAGVRLLERVALLKAEGKTVWDELDRIALKYGLFRSLQWSFRFEDKDAEKMTSMMESLRKMSPGSMFFHAGLIAETHDLLAERYQDFAHANILLFFLSDGTRIVVRPSGTEPKIKFYAEKSTKVDSKETLDVYQKKFDGDLLDLQRQVIAALGMN